MWKLVKATAIGLPFVLTILGGFVGFVFLVKDYPEVTISIFGAFMVIVLSAIFGSIIIGED